VYIDFVNPNEQKVSNLRGDYIAMITMVCIVSQEGKVKVGMRIYFRLEKGFQNFTRSAALHLILPVLASITTAIGSVNKPA
jgi:hypothetical protein